MIDSNGLVNLRKVRCGARETMYVHGQNLIRARDINLPAPTDVTYPVYDESGTNFLATYDVPSFSTWQMTRSMTCPFTPCINPLARPNAALGAINQFESAASSVYHGATLSVRRRMTDGLYFRLAYTHSGTREITGDRSNPCCRESG